MASGETVPVGSGREWLVSCDESGIGGLRYYGFGTLWMPWDRRGVFVGDIEALGEQHGVRLATTDGVEHEFKWGKVKSQKLPFYKAVVDYFFERPWLSFHCLVVRKADVDRTLHKDLDEARRKHFTMLLTNKIRRALKKHPTRRDFRVWVDPIPSAQKKADEAVEVIAGRILRKVGIRPAPLLKVTTHTSHSTRSIQLCDLLLGAVMSAWQQDVEAGGKVALQRHLAGHLGWTDLRADTFETAAKFNTWFFCNPNFRPKDVISREVNLKVPPAASGGAWAGPAKT